MTTKDYSQIFIHVSNADDINVTNISSENASPYKSISVNSGEPFLRSNQLKKGKPQCEYCFCEFSTFSNLYKHQAKPCYEDTSIDNISYPIKISFKKEQLQYIEDILNNIDDITLETSNNDEYFFIIDKTKFELTMRRLYVGQITKYNLEEWYKPLEELAKENNVKEYTQKTLIIPLNDDELHLISKWASITLSNAMGMSSRPTNAELDARYKLEDKIESIIKENQKDDKQQIYFCKFSTRSPKDSCGGSEYKNESIETRIKKKIETLQVKSGQDAFNLLIKSQRIFTDINLYFQYRIKGSSSGELALLLREWCDMHPAYEFRCYVHNKKLTAISQYHCYCRFECLQNEDHINKIRDTICNFHEETKQAFKTNSYVIDICVNPNDYSCSIIELNPFGKAMSSGSGLYHWENDSKVLFGEINLPKPPIRILESIEDSEKTDKSC